VTPSRRLADGGWDGIVGLVEQSATFRLLSGASRALGASARGSFTASAIDRARRSLADVEAWQRVRLAGVVALSAVLTHLLLLRVVPARSAPAMPRDVWTIAGVASVVLVAAPREIARAWPASVCRRLWVWLIQPSTERV
jgi:hypothetical protein